MNSNSLLLRFSQSKSRQVKEWFASEFSYIELSQLKKNRIPKNFIDTFGYFSRKMFFVAPPIFNRIKSSWKSIEIC